MPDLFDSARHVPDHFAPPMSHWPDEAKTAIEALHEEIDIRDDATAQCLEDLEFCVENLARVVRDGVPEWSRALFHEVLRRINRNI